MPINYSDYPKNWKTEIRPRILARAGDCCEQCGLANYARGVRDKAGIWHSVAELDMMGVVEACSLFGRNFPPTIRIVLTIAHLNHDVTDNRPENLKALCQRCHLRMDKEQHERNARATRNKNKGLQNLFPE